MPVRHNILENDQARASFIEGVLRLNRELVNLDSQTAGADGPNLQLSTWDLFVLWHHYTMNELTPPPSPGQTATFTDRNAAHLGPVFLPWHRWMLLLLEASLQRVLGDPDFGLPYWDWAADGDLPAQSQPDAPLWGHLGRTTFPLFVTDGPFALRPDDPGSFRVRLEVRAGQLTARTRPLFRFLGTQPDGTVERLPTSGEVTVCLQNQVYDVPDWDYLSNNGLRNRLEGNRPHGLHNQVHVWVGGDMGSSTSPNDPAFYLNHCNVDRLWEGWMVARGRQYQPDDTMAGPDLFRHRRDDPLVDLLTAMPGTTGRDGPPIAQLLDLAAVLPPTQTPTYDHLPTVP